MRADRSLRRRAAGILAGIALSLCPFAAEAQPRPLLVVLRPTGEVRDGLPVMVQAEDHDRYERALSRGYAGRLLRLYAAVQDDLARREGRVAEPAYLALTSATGGYPRTGFVLGTGPGAVPKPLAGWVDLRWTSALTGRYGAIDQIFPHELWHVLEAQLAGPLPRGPSRQVHAIGVRTDPVTAYLEGLAEHAQILAVDDPDALPETAALARSDADRIRAEEDVAAYARELTRWWPIAPRRWRLPLWFSQDEQVLRYFAVKTNRFGRDATPPDALLDRPDRLAAYWWQAIVLPPADAPWKIASVQWATDGPVAHFFWRLSVDPSLRGRPVSDAIAAEFGLDRPGAAPLDAVGLKTAVVLREARPETTAAFVRGWQRVFPEDAGDVERIARAALGGQPLPEAPAIWLTSASLQVGTSVFDQFRALPQAHGFDANAATLLDWLSLPGVDRPHARALLAAAPFADLDDLVRRSGVSEDLIRSSARPRRAGNPDDDEADGLSLGALLRPYVFRWAALLAVAVLAATALLVRVEPFGFARWWTAALAAATASVLVVAMAWIVRSAWWMPLAAPVVLCGVPWWAARTFARAGGRRSMRRLPALAPFVAWLLAALPAFLLTRG